MEPEPDSYALALLLTINPSFEIIAGVVLLLLLLIGAAFLSAAEVAFFSLGAEDYEKIQQDNRDLGIRLLKLKEDTRRLHTTILFSSSIVNVAVILLFNAVLSKLLSHDTLGEWAVHRAMNIGLPLNTTPEIMGGVLNFLLALAGATFLLILFAELVPKVYARLNKVYVSTIMIQPMFVIMAITRPLIAGIMGWTKAVERRLAMAPYSAAAGLASRKDIDEAIELTVNRAEDTDQEKDILKSLLKFGDVTVSQIMCARVDVVAVDHSASYNDLLQIVRESGYSRIPVYNEDFDNITGILYVKDLLGHLRETDDFQWQQLVRTSVLFVPETKKISDLLKEFQRQHLHMAIVVDEYGGTSGIVTLEDIMEEVIGEIKDEFDDEPEVIFQKIDEHNYIFEGKTLLNDVCRVVGIDTDTFDEVKGDADSFAGLILELLGDMPREGQEISYNSYHFRIVAVNERRIERILITIANGD